MAAIEYHQLVKKLYGVPDIRVREAQRREITGVSRTAAWKLEKTGKFPERRVTSTNHVSWSMAELLEWADNREKPEVAACSSRYLK
ncbi:MAG: helix-turn-helix transcriptional regulator [Endozoicomonas sp.]